MSTARTATAVLVLCLTALTPAPATALEVGTAVPELALTELGGGERVLSMRSEPTVLVFFRGVW